MLNKVKENELKDAKIVYADIYEPLLDAIKDPNKYGKYKTDRKGFILRLSTTGCRLIFDSYISETSQLSIKLKLNSKSHLLIKPVTKYMPDTDFIKG